MSNDNDHDREHDVTQGENPGAQGDVGAGQGNPGDESSVGETPPTIVGDGQPRRDEVDGDDVDGDELDDRNATSQV